MIEFAYQPGMAHIKPEFIEESFKNRTCKSVKSDDNVEQEKDTTSETSSKKVKTRGMNKKRQHSYQTEHSDLSVKKVCPYIKSSSDCPYGENCNYEHNVEAAKALKPENLPGECYNFQVKGFCKMGFMCLFSHSHTSDSGENLKNEEQMDKYKPVENVLSVEMKDVLRKKKYDFTRSFYHLDKLKISCKDRVCVRIDGCDFSEDTRERKIVDFSNKLYLAPLTTVGNLPFRRICKEFGADITCSEMAMCSKLLQGVQSEWALIKRHPSEDIFGVQLCGSYADSMTRCAQLIDETCRVDFVDINCGCPIDMVCRRGEGCGLLRQGRRLESIVAGITSVLHVPLTVKCRMGYSLTDRTTHTLLPRLREAGASAAVVHGRTREQRFSHEADWAYIEQCAKAAAPMPVLGNGDIMSYEDYEQHLAKSGVAGMMIARGALIKPWIFTEIKQRTTLDISSGERLELLRKFANYGLEYWGSDRRGVENTRRFMLEWLSFLHRYIPVGLLERLPQRVNLRPPPYFGRDQLETLMASANCADWVKISEMLLGPVPDGFHFVPKHRANSYA